MFIIMNTTNKISSWWRDMCSICQKRMYTIEILKSIHWQQNYFFTLLQFYILFNIICQWSNYKQLTKMSQSLNSRHLYYMYNIFLVVNIGVKLSCQLDISLITNMFSHQITGLFNINNAFEAVNYLEKYITSYLL